MQTSKALSVDIELIPLWWRGERLEQSEAFFFLFQTNTAGQHFPFKLGFVVTKR